MKLLAAVLAVALSGCVPEDKTCVRLKVELAGLVRWSDSSFTFSDAAKAWKASGCEHTLKEG